MRLVKTEMLKKTRLEIKWVIDFTFEISFFYARYAILLHF